MGDMSQAKLVEDLQLMLKDAKDKFGSDATQFERLLDFSLTDISRVRPRRLVGTVILQAGVGEYLAPTDMVNLDFPLWGNAERRTRRPWESNHPGRAPSATVFGDAGSKMIALSPPPSATHIADLGTDYKFYYRALHVIGVTKEDTTVAEADRSLLLIRACAQAMNELAANNITKPVSLGNAGVGSMPKNGTPAALSENLMKLFESMANA